MNRIARNVLTGASLLVIVLLLIHKVSSFDVWFHLRAGEWLLAGGGFPSADPFSFTARGEWINLSWVFQIPLALVHRAAGAAGITLANAVVLLAAFGLVAASGRRRGVPLATVAPWLALAALASAQRFFVRPESLSLLYLALALHLTDRALGGQRRALWGFPLLQLLWVNTESLYPLGLAVLAAGAPEAVRRRWRRTAGRASLAPWLLTGLGAVAVGLLNPYGLRGALFPLRMARLVADPENVFNLGIFELKSPFDPQVPLASLLFPALFALALVAQLILRRRRLDAFDLLLLAGFGYLAASSVRNIPLLALAGSFVALRITPPPGARGPSTRQPALRMIAAGMLGVLAAGIVSSGFYATFRLGKVFGLGIDGRLFPDSTLRAWPTGSPPARVMNDHALGHYLIWRLWPQTRVLIDGRSEVYGEAQVRALQPAFVEAAVFDRLARSLETDYALIGHRPHYLEGLLRDLARHPDWSLIAYDHAAALFARGAPSPPAPEALPDSLPIPHPRRRNLLARWFGPARWAAAERHLAPAHLLQLTGDPSGSVREALAAARSDPGSADAFNQLGASLILAGRLPEAGRALTRCLVIDPGYTEALLNLGMVARAARDHVEAERWFREALGAGAPPLAARLRLGEALQAQERYAEAAEEYRRASRLAPRDPRPYLKLGSVVYRAGRHREAAGYYQEAAARGEAFRGLWGAAACLAAGGWRAEAHAIISRAVEVAPTESARRRAEAFREELEQNGGDETGAPQDGD